MRLFNFIIKRSNPKRIGLLLLVVASSVLLQQESVQYYLGIPIDKKDDPIKAIDDMVIEQTVYDISYGDRIFLLKKNYLK